MNQSHYRALLQRISDLLDYRAQLQLYPEQLPVGLSATYERQRIERELSLLRAQLMTAF